MVTLRVCARCEWIFTSTDNSGCPMCSFGSYGAYCVYGNNAYKYKKTQEPWKTHNMNMYSYELDNLIYNNGVI